MSEIRKLFRELSDKGIKDAVIGKVIRCQQTTPTGWSIPDRIKAFWCDVEPERSNEATLQYVPMPMRVINAPDDLGVIFVPKVDTEVIVSWIDGRPTMLASREWDRMILKKGENLWIEIAKNDDIFVQTRGQVDVKVGKSVTEEITLSKHVKCPLIKLGQMAPHPVVMGDMLVTWLSTHTHTLVPVLTPAGFVTSPPLQNPALPGVLSKVTFTD
ncbi:hypothetical protein GF359_05065 [candidate division WOR-3 bacterium]|uniref:Uncharacterized protein n=1 Tax=candidate division WOR-3 bacterium TaxID=2052148 RepID=A0A9D5KB79_UNCW3|nr:hypothetical protein [candidate division WOR-3 bacterium]MBD3364566.1 hypothetical protein [candidate division WOR-3 bacterium]